MLEEIISDDFSVVQATNEKLFCKDVDYEAIRKQHGETMKEWSKLPDDEKAKHKNAGNYLKFRNVPDLKELGAAKHYSLLLRETNSRINSPIDMKLLQLDGFDLENSLLDLVESLENVDEIRSLYVFRKKLVGSSSNAGIAAAEAKRLQRCFAQGRELYLAGKNGSLMVKPLNFFYALTAYSYGIIVLNNPIRYNKGNLKGSHGMQYLPDKVYAQFGGDTPRGTFSDLFCSFPSHQIKSDKVDINLDLSNSVLAYEGLRNKAGLGLMLSMIPEMAEYYQLTTGRHSRCYPLEIVSANDHRQVRWEFLIGNGEQRPPRESVEKAFPGFACGERYGKTLVTVSASEAHKICACIYTDIKGQFWFIDNPFFPLVLPEVCLHFLINNVFSSIMRYRPDEWGDVLQNEVPSNISLITRHYFSSFQRKFFLVILRALSRYLPYVA